MFGKAIGVLALLSPKDDLAIDVNRLSYKQRYPPKESRLDHQPYGHGFHHPILLPLQRKAPQLLGNCGFRLLRIKQNRKIFPRKSQACQRI
ncbi:hypothetical protein D3C80_1654110 [compost metagenome]